MGYPPYVVRQYSYRQLQLAGLDEVPDPAKLDLELNTLVAAYNALAKRERAYTTPSGALTQVPTASSLSLSSTTRFVATAGQTSFVVPTYDNTADTVEVWSGAAGSGMTMLDPNNVTKTDTTHVTIPAQSLGAIVVILVFSSGSSILATLAVDGTSGGTSGATLIGFYGSGLFTSHTVESALVEFKTTYNAFITAIGSVGNVLRADGSVPLAANLPAGGHKITGLAAGTVAGDSVEYSQFSSFASVWNTLQAYYAKLDGTTPWTGNWDAGSHRLTNLANGVGAQDAVTVAQLTTGAVQTGKNAIVNGGCRLKQGITYAATVSGTYDYGQVDMILGALIGTTVAGSLAQGTTTPPGSTGKSAKWSAVTLTGAGQAVLRTYIESVNAQRFVSKQAYVGVNVKHSCLAAVDVTVSVYAANAADNFSGGMTLVGSVTQSVAPATDVRISMTPLAGGISTAGNGLCVQVSFAAGACSGVTFEAADWQFEMGGYSTFEQEDITVSAARCYRYFVRYDTDGHNNGIIIGHGAAQTTNQTYIYVSLPVDMRTIYTATVSGTWSVVTSAGAVTVVSLSIATAPWYGKRTAALSVVTGAGTVTVDKPYYLYTTDLAGYLYFDSRLT